MGASDEYRSLRVGVVGLGWAGRQHLDAYSKIPGVEVAALASMEADELTALADEFGVPGRYGRWEDLLEENHLDALSVCAPPHLHAPIAVAALQAGTHVLSEKPMALSGDEARQMADTARKANRVLQVAFNHRRRGDVKVLKRHIGDGHLGHIYYAKARWLRRNGIPKGTGWFTSKALAGGGPLTDLGVHMLDIALYLLGEPRVVSASAATYAELGPRQPAVHASAGGRPPLFDVEDLASAFLRLDGGETLTLEASWAGYPGSGDRFGVTLFGDKGGAEIDVANYSPTDTLRIYQDVGGAPAEIRPLLPPGGDHREVVAEFVDAIRGGQWERHQGAEGLARTRIIDACYQSASEGREVSVITDRLQGAGTDP
jgi:predicted dehydrogenase